MYCIRLLQQRRPPARYCQLTASGNVVLDNYQHNISTCQPQPASSSIIYFLRYQCWVECSTSNVPHWPRIYCTVNLPTYPQMFCNAVWLCHLFPGIRSQREAFISSRAKTALDCVLFCFEQKTCKSFNYADYNSVSDGEENCELHNEIKNDDGNPLEFLKDDRYTFYQIPGASHKPENTQKTENATEQVYIYLPLSASKLQSRSHAIFSIHATMEKNTLHLRAKFT